MSLPRTSFKFTKAEHLCSRRVMESLFETGKRINETPFRLLWIESASADKVAVKIAFSVPKKLFKKAVDRNKIKRQMREAYRLNRNRILEETANTERQFAALLIFSGKQLISYSEAEAKIILTLQRFAKDACKN